MCGDVASGELIVTLNFLPSSFCARVSPPQPAPTITMVLKALSRGVDSLLQHGELVMKQGRWNCEPGLCAEGINWNASIA